jgi:hypothetical protein
VGPGRKQKNVFLRSRQVKNFASARIRPISIYRFGTTRCKITVAGLPAWKSWTGLKSSVPGFWMGSKGMFQGD